jgi:hypothetical protein
MNAIVILPALGFFAVGLLVQQLAQPYRTRESLANEERARTKISWYFTRYFYWPKDFEPPGRTIFLVGQALYYGGLVWMIVASLIPRS